MSNVTFPVVSAGRGDWERSQDNDNCPIIAIHLWVLNTKKGQGFSCVVILSVCYHMLISITSKHTLEDWVALQNFSLSFSKAVASIYNQNSLWDTKMEKDCIIYLKATHQLGVIFFYWEKKIREIREIN